MKDILKSIEICAKKIATELKYADFGYADGQNASGDRQLKLDILSDKIIASELRNCQSVKILASEERQKGLETANTGLYIVAYDPLDGSSLVDVNFAVGSIFGIYKDILSARALVGAVYVVYGPRTEMVVADENGVKLYRLNQNDEFVVAKELKLNEKGKLNATGGTQKDWDEKHKELIKSLFDEGYRLRYSGAMVSDLHQILLKGGGLFSYPATSSCPKGKLRLGFEVLPFAFIYERAGGFAINEKGQRLLEISLSDEHETTPCYFGSKYEIDKVRACLV